MDMEEHPLLDTVLSCVMPYIHDGDDRNSISLASRKLCELDGITRNHITVHVHYSPSTSRLSRRFPNIELLTLTGLISGDDYPLYHVAPWIRELTLSFKRFNALSISDMRVVDSDLELLGRTRGKDLRVLKIVGNHGCGLSKGGLVHVFKYCNQLRTFCFQDYYQEEVDIYGNWLHELALHNKVIESLQFHISYINYYHNDWKDGYDGKDLALLAKNCSKSLVSLKISPCSLSKLGEAFRHAVWLEDSDGAYFDEDDEFVDFKFPPDMRCLSIRNLPVSSYPLVLPLVNQLRELNLQSIYPFKRKCHCFLIEKCPNLVVLYTDDVCGYRGLQVIGQFCKKLRELTHLAWVTHKGLISLAQGCCNLEYLDVKLGYITNEALECIGTHLKNLCNFSMILGKKSGRTDLPLDNGIRSMLNGCSKLESLDIRLCTGGLTDMGLGYIGKYGHNLKYLFLENIGESDAGLLELSKGCPKLRELEMKSCPFNEKSIVAYAFNIHSLRYLRVFYKSGDLVSTRPDFGVSPTGLNCLYPDFEC